LQGIVLDKCIPPTSQARESPHVLQALSLTGYRSLAHELDHCPHQGWLVFEVSVQLRLAGFAR
jgi:hypothetical protein